MAGVASSKDRETSLNRLEASLNKIYLQVGGVFSAGVPSGASRLSKMRAQLNSSVPQVVGGLNDALDTLEGDLMRARAILTRDLRLLHAADPNQVANDEQKTSEMHKPVIKDSRGMISTNGDEVMSIPEDPNTSPAYKQDTLQVPPTAPTTDMSRETQDNGAPKALDLPTKIKAEEERAQSSGPNTDNKPVDNATSTSTSNPTHLPQQPVSKAVSDTDQVVTSQPQDLNNAENKISDAMTEEATKDEQAEPSPGNDFSSLLPGLDMYANDPSGDVMSSMDQFTEMNNTNTFDLGNSADSTDDLFGTSDMNPDMNQLGDDLMDDMISFDANNASGETGQMGTGQAVFEEFDDDFFNISGT